MGLIAQDRITYGSAAHLAFLCGLVCLFCNVGNVLAETICRVFKIEEPVAKGIAIGSSSHALGTAKALELGEIEGAMSSLSIAVAGILTVIAAPIFATLL